MVELLLSNANNAVELGTVIITLLISFYGYKIYKITKIRRYKLFTTTFLFLSLAVFSKAVTNLLTNNGLIPTRLGVFGNLVYATLLITSYTFLNALVLKIKYSKATTIFSLLILQGVLLTYFVNFKFAYLTTIALLIEPVSHFFKNYQRKRKTTTLLTFLAFTGLTFSYLFNVITIPELMFVDNALRVISYSLLLLQFLMVMRKR